ncbi:hypothetical protein [Dactylosporangium sp. NPDC048998]|uniref:hypothetical protein n=1 Tax=Dactylosporangium sp. NPDC048998 TaxID=3363976 RepID=UPI003712F2CA
MRMLPLRATALAGVLLTCGLLIACAEPPDPPPLPEPSPPLRASPYPMASDVTYRSYCGSSPNCPAGSVPATLRRDFAVDQQWHCVATSNRNVGNPFGAALANEGPVQLIIGGNVSGNAQVRFAFPPTDNTLFAGTGYGGANINFTIEPSYGGPVLVRGRRVDGDSPVGFAEGRPLAELQLPPTSETPGAWRAFPTYLRLRDPGCYVLQIDGLDFSTRIMLPAAIAP